MHRHAALVAFVLICGVLALDVAHYLPLVPDPLASHFGFSGRPNGWTSHFRMIAGLAGLVLLFAAIFAATFFFGRIPDRLINVPKQDILAGTRTPRSDASLCFSLAALVLGVDARLFNACCWPHLSRQFAQAAAIVGRRAWGAHHLSRRSGGYGGYPLQALA